MTDIVAAGSRELDAPLMRFRCVGCSTEVSMQAGSYEQAMDLLVHHGWRVGSTLMCAACMRKKASRFKKEFFE